MVSTSWKPNFPQQVLFNLHFNDALAFHKIFVINSKLKFLLQKN